MVRSTVPNTCLPLSSCSYVRQDTRRSHCTSARLASLLRTSIARGVGVCQQVRARSALLLTQCRSVDSQLRLRRPRIFSMRAEVDSRLGCSRAAVGGIRCRRAADVCQLGSITKGSSAQALLANNLARTTYSYCPHDSTFRLRTPTQCLSFRPTMKTCILAPDCTSYTSSLVASVPLRLATYWITSS